MFCLLKNYARKDFWDRLMFCTSTDLDQLTEVADCVQLPVVISKYVYTHCFRGAFTAFHNLLQHSVLVFHR